MKNVEEKILNKIRKVLALTKSTYQEEAHTALLKAQELMAQHGLTMAEVEATQEKCEDKQVVDTCVAEKRRNYWYEKNLSKIIGDNFRCHCYVSPGRGIYFIGLKEDVEIATEVYHYALNTMLYLSTDYVKRYQEQTISNQRLKNDYYIGFLKGLGDKFKAQVETKGYALVLVKDALVIQAVNDKKLTKGQSSKIVIGGSSDARDAGYRDGRSFDEKHKRIG
ncbi:DUF2786 domain-containing protein [Desulfofalx alkaliphila]|uniref:DUF2786 domain-containing protein n=1 Tax=Desulfofalx alkaliphila TaxID=105483 RepID=UPI0004E13B65|nr:DUF2786 domain-containing protein [Desulfofalx alkaliphila]